MTESTNINRIWPTLNYDDARAAVAFLTGAFGFEVGTIHEGEASGSVVHAELLWPDGGGIMLGTTGEGQPPFNERKPGNDLVYIVCTDPDGLCERARSFGAEIAMELRDTDYGSRDFAVRDPEGNLWSFGTYTGSTLDSD